MNLFLVTDATGGEPGGFTALPGGKTNGSPYSGVYVVYDHALTEAALATRAAHEVGHQLGLVGSPDPANLMHEAAPGAFLTPAQAHVLLRHVLLEPGKP